MAGLGGSGRRGSVEFLFQWVDVVPRGFHVGDGVSELQWKKI